DGTLVHPFVTWFIDCATKAITGLAVTPGTPTGASVLAALRSAIVPTALTRANMELLREEIIQVDELITKCETDLDSLTDSDRATVESWIHSRDRFVAVIPVAAALAGRALRVSAVEAKHTWT
ncbi:hypothetical protein, partial [Streptomyces sp. NPDC005989]|uniref:hypothetical protein n=1 Tax=Streptomyces sp. NPDC005989 TaxID=3156727 RepID=UPI0033F6E007